MAENGKTKIILTVIIGLFGVMCFGFALTVTDKYKTARDKVAVLEKKFEAGKNELLKIPELKEKVVNAEEQAKGALSELEYVQEELDETTEELDETTEELDEVTEELEALKAQLEEGAGEGEDAEEGGDEELVSQLSGANDQIESLKAELESAEKTISELKSRPAATVSSPSVSASAKSEGFTFDGLYNVDPNAEIGDGNIAHRGLDYHRKVESKPEPKATDKNDSKQLVKKQINVINANISELLSYASEKVNRKERIGAKAYAADLAQKSEGEKAKITKALNDILANYANMYKVISSSDSFTSYERGRAKNSLKKRISNYVSELQSKNQAGAFSLDDKHIQMILTKIQSEQKYFLN